MLPRPRVPRPPTLSPPGRRPRVAPAAIALAVALVAVSTLVPAAGSATAHPWWCVGCGDTSVADAVRNVALFVPLGAALRAAGGRWARAAAAAAACSVAVELLQAAGIPGATRRSATC
jgi:hypothetical protein